MTPSMIPLASGSFIFWYCHFSLFLEVFEFTPDAFQNGKRMILNFLGADTTLRVQVHSTSLTQTLA